MRPKPLSQPQYDALKFIHDYQIKHGYMPMFKDIEAGLKLKRISAVSPILKALEKKGWIAREKRKYRAIQILNYPRTKKFIYISSGIGDR